MGYRRRSSSRRSGVPHERPHGRSEGRSRRSPKGGGYRMNGRPTALIADDEPLLRDELAALLAQAWPELQVVAQARNGREAVDSFEALRPDVCFLDVQMPGLSGVDAARQIGTRAHV